MNERIISNGLTRSKYMNWTVMSGDINELIRSYGQDMEYYGKYPKAEDPTPELERCSLYQTLTQDEKTHILSYGAKMKEFGTNPTKSARPTPPQLKLENRVHYYGLEELTEIRDRYKQTTNLEEAKEQMFMDAFKLGLSKSIAESNGRQIPVQDMNYILDSICNSPVYKELKDFEKQRFEFFKKGLEEGKKYKTGSQAESKFAANSIRNMQNSLKNDNSLELGE